MVSSGRPRPVGANAGLAMRDDATAIAAGITEVAADATAAALEQA